MDDRQFFYIFQRMIIPTLAKNRNSLLKKKSTALQSRQTETTATKVNFVDLLLVTLFITSETFWSYRTSNE
jgi:hypothetical protein